MKQQDGFSLDELIVMALLLCTIFLYLLLLLCKGIIAVIEFFKIHKYTTLANKAKQKLSNEQFVETKKV